MTLMDKYFDAAALVRTTSAKKRTTGGLSQTFIKKIEGRLGTPMPESFKRFLRDFGYLVIAGQEFYGEVEREAYGGGLPSFVWATEQARARGDALASDLVVRSSGYGPNYVLACSEMSEIGEAPVYLVSIAYDPETDTTQQHREKVADSYGEFFHQEVSGVLNV